MMLSERAQYTLVGLGLLGLKSIVSDERNCSLVDFGATGWIWVVHRAVLGLTGDLVAIKKTVET